MPLSDREQRVLDDLERDLLASDPKLVASLVEHQPRLSASRAVALSIAGITVGFVLVLTGLVLNLVVVSVVGFLLIVGAIVRVTGR